MDDGNLRQQEEKNESPGEPFVQYEDADSGQDQQPINPITTYNNVISDYDSNQEEGELPALNKGDVNPLNR